MILRLSAVLVLASSATFAQQATEQPAPTGTGVAAPENEPEPAGPGLSATVRSSRSTVTRPQSVSVLNRDDVRRTEGVFLDDVLNLIPGVRFESRTAAGGQRITIRGYGNGTNFNGTGYKAYLNGIPLTDAEGTTILDDLDTSLLGRIEVVKGPESSLYGTGIGGVVRFDMLTPVARETRLTQEVTGGSNALVRSNTRLEHASDTASVLVNYGHQHTDGYRQHSASDKDFALLTADYKPSSRQSLSVLASYNHSFEQLAGQLTEAQFLKREDFAEVPYLANNAHVAIDSLRFGLAHRYQFTPGFGNTTSAFGSGYQLNQPFAAGLTDNLVLNVGARTEFTGRFTAGGVGFLTVLGSEIERSTAFKKSYGLTAGVLGAMRGDLQVTSLQSNTFLEATALLPLEISVTAGASLNVVRYAISDRIAPSASHPDQSGKRTFDPVITPRIAVQKTFARDVSVYAQVSQGYTAPGSSAVVIPQLGRVNNDLKPETGTLYEVGSKGSLLDSRLGYEVALFDLRVTDKLTPQALTANGATFNITVNGGNQDNVGLEAATRYALLRSDEGAVKLVQLFGGYAYSQFRYDSFRSNQAAGGVSYDGNKVVGVPEHVITGGLDALTSFGVYGNVSLQHVSPIELTYDNQHGAKAYTLLNAKVGYRRDLPYGFRLDASVGGKNLTDSTYYTMAFLNQTYPTPQSPNVPAPAVFLPGPGAQIFGGLDLSKAF